MEDIHRIYHNEIGISFQWKHARVSTEQYQQEQIQMVFRDMGFYLTKAQMVCFAKNITHAIRCKKCKDCSMQPGCRSILLKSPLQGMDLAVNEKELHQIQDLIKGTLFQLDLEQYLQEVCNN